MNLTTFVISMSLPVTIQHRRCIVVVSSLFKVQKHIDDKSNEEMYSIRHPSRKLLERYNVEGSKV